MPTGILVVDDSKVQRSLVESLLQRNPDFRIQHAANGCEALTLIAVNPPDLVVTDLVMPEMDGLELVRTMRRQHPEIPVILMTAYGDEATAIQALESGAASYVPKGQKAERLLSEVERLTEFARAKCSREQLTRCTLEYHCRLALENDRQLIQAAATQIQRQLAGIGFGDSVERIRVAKAFEEALLNAMYHGNLELSARELAAARAQLDDQMLDKLVAECCLDPGIRRRRILVVIDLTKSEARFVIRDEGSGFNDSLVVTEKATDCFGDGKCRGMTLMRSLMDEVKFNKSGNELVLRKQLK